MEERKWPKTISSGKYEVCSRTLNHALERRREGEGRSKVITGFREGRVGVTWTSGGLVDRSLQLYHFTTALIRPLLQRPVQVQQQVFWCLRIIIFTPERRVRLRPAGLRPEFLLLWATPRRHDESRRVLPLLGIFSAQPEEVRLLVFESW